MFLEQIVVEILKKTEASAEEISLMTGFDPDLIVTIIDRLEILGIIEGEKTRFDNTNT